MAKHPSWQLTRTERVTYSVGMFSSAIVTATIMAWVLYYYSPPPNAVDQGMLFLAVGLAVGVARLISASVDALSNPLVAFWSDRSPNPKGRRSPFIRRGAIPLMILAILVWFPPVRGSSVWNVVWLTVTMSGTWFFFTYVVAPYLALMPELSSEPDERVSLTVTMSYWEAGATVIAALAVPPIIDALKGGVQMGPVFIADGFKFTAVVLAIMGGIGFFVSVSKVREKPIPPEDLTDLSLWRSIVECFRNPAFPPYLIAVAIAKVAIGLMMISLPFFAVAVLHKSEGFTAALFAPLFISTILGFVIGEKLVNRVGLKRAFRMATLVGAFVFVGFFSVYYLGGDALPLQKVSHAPGGDLVLSFGDSAATGAEGDAPRFHDDGDGVAVRMTALEMRSWWEQEDLERFQEQIRELEDAGAAALLRGDTADRREEDVSDAGGPRAWLLEQDLETLVAHLKPTAGNKLFKGPKRRFNDSLAFVTPTMLEELRPAQPVRLRMNIASVEAPEETFNLDGWTTILSTPAERRALPPALPMTLGALEAFDFTGSVVYADGSVVFQGFEPMDKAATDAAVARLTAGGMDVDTLQTLLGDTARIDHMLSRFDLRVELSLSSRIIVVLFVCFLLGFPAAILMSMYRPIVCEIVDEDERRVGFRREAMYFGVEGLLTKFADGLAGLIVPIVILIGHLFAAPPFGYVLSFGAGAILMFIAWWVFKWYPLGGVAGSDEKGE